MPEDWTYHHDATEEEPTGAGPTGEEPTGEQAPVGPPGGSGWYYNPADWEPADPGPHAPGPYRSGPSGWGAPGWGPPGWAPYGQDVPRRSPARRTAIGVVVAALVLASGGLGAAIGVAVHHRSLVGSSTVPQLPFFHGGQDGGGTPTTIAPTAGIDAGAVAAKVDPSVVDIDTTLGGGGRAAGTGIVLTSGGLILTNNHVIADATSITVQVPSTGRSYSGTVIGYDLVDDVAVVRLRAASGLKPASFGSSSSLGVGTPVVAIGNALGQGGTPAATEGTITALNQNITVQGEISPGETLKNLVQFSAPIQPGDSGGPLVNARGRVIGMDTAAAFDNSFRFQDAPSNAGFAIPINTALSIAQQITSGKTGGNINTGPRPLLGIEVSDPGAAPRFGGGFGGGFGQTAPSTSGAEVIEVNPGSPAASIGLEAGDVITSLAGQSISDASSLTTAILRHKVGDTVSIGWVDQSGASHGARVTFEAGPPA